LTASDVHWDVASYALGVLDEPDLIEFEQHMLDCALCVEELDSLLSVTGLLAYATPPEIDVDAERDRLMVRAANVVAFERSKDRARWVLVSAAAAVLVLIASGLAYWLGSQVNRPGDLTAAPPGATAPTNDVPHTIEPSPGFGGETNRGDHFDGSDPGSGLKADLVLQQRGAQTELTMVLTEFKGPVAECQLVAVTVGGFEEVVTTWQVPKAGFGTAAHPGPLVVNGVISIPRADIEHFEVRSITGDTSFKPLLSVWV
jgi:hypothetical protein